MPDKSHWPFGKDAGDDESRERERATEREHERQTEQEQARLAKEITNKQHPTVERFIAGGRGHTKKRGLS